MQHKSSLSTIMVGRDISAGFAAYVKVGMEEILVLVLGRKAAIRFGRHLLPLVQRMQSLSLYGILITNSVVYAMTPNFKTTTESS